MFLLSEKLLVIELENGDSIPKVFYKGVELKNKTLVDFHWKTKTGKDGEMVFLLKHIENNVVNMIYVNKDEV